MIALGAFGGREEVLKRTERDASQAQRCVVVPHRRAVWLCVDVAGRSAAGSSTRRMKMIRRASLGDFMAWAATAPGARAGRRWTKYLCYTSKYAEPSRQGGRRAQWVCRRGGGARRASPAADASAEAPPSVTHSLAAPRGCRPASPDSALAPGCGSFCRATSRPTVEQGRRSRRPPQ